MVQTRPRNFVLHCNRLPVFDCVALPLLSPAWMQGTGRTRCFSARLRPYSARRNRYGFLTAQRHTADQKKTTMVLGFLAARNYFRDCSPGSNCSYRARNLAHSISSLRAGCRCPRTAIKPEGDWGWLTRASVSTTEAAPLVVLSTGRNHGPKSSYSRHHKRQWDDRSPDVSGILCRKGADF